MPTLIYHLSRLGGSAFPFSLRCCGRRRAGAEVLVEVIIKVLDGIGFTSVISVIQPHCDLALMEVPINK
jgi:hypothetical protein